MLLPLLVGMQVVQGVCVAQADVGFGSMVADVVDEQEFDSGKRQEGMFFAGFGFVSVWCFSRYRLTRQRHSEILRVLARRREGGLGVTRHGAS